MRALSACGSCGLALSAMPELLRLREQPLSWCAVLDRVNDGWATRNSAASLAAS